MSWMITKDKLDETQRNIIKALGSEENNLFIQGPAGCGKSVVLIHAVQDLLDKNEAIKILLVSFTHSLLNLYKSGLRADLHHRVTRCTMQRFKTLPLESYDYIVIDEVQDIKQPILERLRASKIPLISAGDYFQSIYDDTCEIDELKSLGNIKEPILPVIYRNTKSIHAIASYFSDSPEIYRAYEVDNKQNDTSVQMAEFLSNIIEVQYTWGKARQIAEAGESVVIILPNRQKILDFFAEVCRLEDIEPWEQIEDRYGKPDYDLLNSYCDRHQLPLHYLGNNYGDFQDNNDHNRVTVMTYHSVKGLDFNAVFLPWLTNDMRLWGSAEIERRLFFVALTRARKELFLSYHGLPHHFLDLIPEHTASKVLNPNINEVVSDAAYDEVLF